MIWVCAGICRLGGCAAEVSSGVRQYLIRSKAVLLVLVRRVDSRRRHDWISLSP